MNSENFVPQEETIQDGELTEKHELDPSSREVVGIIAEDAKRLESDGEYELEGLSEGLSENDPKVASTREHLASIAKRAKELPKWAAAALALSVTQPAEAQEIPAQAQYENEIVVTASAKPYKLERNNPQREGYATPEGYRKYLDDTWERLRAPHSLEPFSLEETAEAYYGKKFNDLSEEERRDVERISFHYQNRTRVLNQEVEAGLDRTPFDAARSLPDAEIERQSGEYQEAIQNLDDQREWLAGVVHSPEYKRRLLVNERINKAAESGVDYFKTVYTDGKPYTFKVHRDIPENPLETRRQRVTEDILHVSDLKYPIEDSKLGRWNMLTEQAVINKDEALDPESSAGVHELAHHVTDGETGISPAAEWLYSRAFNKDFVSEVYPDHVEYFSNPSELDAYKKAFEYELEQLTDWHYGEPFTPKLMEQARELYEEGKLKGVGARFLEIIKPEYLIKVMNTLAANESQPEVEGRPREERA
ncbi:MAG: hypothetical protein RLZZ480_360 [Candidatus Parcubacteria bacterium]|jgi:hypothetical protein